MIPNQFTPECHKIHIIALPKTPNVKGVRRKKAINRKNEARSTKQKDGKFHKYLNLIYTFYMRILYYIY